MTDQKEEVRGANRDPLTGETDFRDHEPAYRYGWESATLQDFRNSKFEEVKPELARGWPARGRVQQDWRIAREATRDAWDRARR